MTHFLICLKTIRQTSHKQLKYVEFEREILKRDTAKGSNTHTEHVKQTKQTDETDSEFARYRHVRQVDLKPKSVSVCETLRDTQTHLEALRDT